MAKTSLSVCCALCTVLLYSCSAKRVKMATAYRSKQHQGHQIGSVLRGRFRLDRPAFVVSSFVPGVAAPAHGRSMLPRVRRDAQAKIGTPHVGAARRHWHPPRMKGFYNDFDHTRGAPFGAEDFLQSIGGGSKVNNHAPPDPFGTDDFLNQLGRASGIIAKLNDVSSGIGPGRAFPPGTEFDGQAMKHLGMGQFGDVWEATDLKTGEQVVVKIYTLRTGEEEWQYLTWNMADKRMKWTMIKSVEECKIVQKMVSAGKQLYPTGASHICDCKQEHISQGMANPDQVMYTVWEKGGREDLTTLKMPNNLEARISVARTITKQVAEVLVLLSMFDPPIIHHDLKPDNIMVSGSMTEGFDVKIIDFGCFLPATEEMRTSISMGDHHYMPPEHTWDTAFADPPSSFDIWAWGLIHMQLLCPEYTHEHWYPSDGTAPVGKTVLEGMRHHCSDLFDYDKFASIADDLYLIERCLAAAPTERPRPTSVVTTLASLLQGPAAALAHEHTTFKKGDTVEVLGTLSKTSPRWREGVVTNTGDETYDIELCDDNGCQVYSDVEPAHVKGPGKDIPVDVPDVRPTEDMFAPPPDQ